MNLQEIRRLVEDTGHESRTVVSEKHTGKYDSQGHDHRHVLEVCRRRHAFDT
jgi:hypothetical protein